ncbi:type 4a pilus biogenesis protein PilO [Planctomycetales bacterium ZRK34]|nr:type 4a pilus biogenesis protein PilO [Planctomycetales bacterium ZRK34]
MRFGLRELIFVMLLIGVLFASWQIVFKKDNQDIAQALEEKARMQRKLQELQLATRQIDDLGREIDKLTSAIDLFEAKLPAEKEIDVILKDIWQMADKHGLKSRSVKADKAKQNNRYSEAELSMIILGDFNSFYSFLLDLERLSRITCVREMSLGKLKKADEGQMEARFTLTIFFEPQSADKPA